MSINILPTPVSTVDNVVYLGRVNGVGSGANFTITHNKNYAFKGIICFNLSIQPGQLIYVGGSSSGAGASFVSMNNNQVTLNNSTGITSSYFVLGIM